jgi:hypothetical protein
LIFLTKNNCTNTNFGKNNIMQKLIVLMLLSFLSVASVAQTTTGTKPATTKSKIPVVKAYWGTYTSGTYTIAQLKNIIDNALILKDDKGTVYTLKRCSFLYKRKLVNKDDETGVTTTTWEYAEKILKNGAQLDDQWKKTLKEEMKEGEEFIFGAIVADSKKGYVIPVSNINFIVKK